MKTVADFLGGARSSRRGALLRSMSSVAGLRPAPPPLLTLSRAPHRPDQDPPWGLAARNHRRILPRMAGIRFPQVKEEGRCFFGPGDTEGIGYPLSLAGHEA